MTQLLLTATQYDNITKQPGNDNLLYRIYVDKLAPELMDYRGNSGYFYEFDCKSIMDIIDFCDDTRCQTIGVLGDSSTISQILEHGIRGVDRIVPIGHTMDFDLIWDGYNLVEELTRSIGVV